MKIHNLVDLRKKQLKYRNTPTVRDGIRFDSKKEANYYSNVVKPSLAEGRFVMCLRQVPFHLPGGTVYRVDFLEFHADGTVHVVDVKGKETEAFKIKKREVEHHYPVIIEVK